MKKLRNRKSLFVHIWAYLLIVIMVCPSISVKADSELNVSLTVDNNEQKCNYRLTGVESLAGETLQVTVHEENSSEPVYNKTFPLTNENCSSGIYKGTFSAEDFDEFALGKYVAYFSIVKRNISTKASFEFKEDEVIQGSKSPSPTQPVTTTQTPETLKSAKPSQPPKADIAESKDVLSVDASTGAISRKVSFHPELDSEIDASVKSAGLYVWKKGTPEQEAKMIGQKLTLEESKQGWVVEIPKLFKGYGTFYAKVVLYDEQGREITHKIEPVHFIVQPEAKSFTAKITKQLESQQSFAVNLNEVSSIYEVKEVLFNFYNSANQKVYSVKAKDADGKGTYYSRIISLKELNYKLDKYTVKAVLYDRDNGFKQFATTATIDLTADPGTCKIVNNENKTLNITLKNGYLPGKIKKVVYSVYDKADGEKKAKKFIASYLASKDTYTATINATSLPNGSSGTYMVKVYAYSQWEECFLINTASFKFYGIKTSITGGSIDSRKGTFVFTIHNIKSGVSSVTAKVWCSGEKNDSYTYTAKKRGNNYQVTVSAKNHKYHFGNYHVAVYTKTGKGGKVKVATGTYRFKPENYVYMKDSKLAYAKVLYIYNPSKTGKITFQVYSKTKGTDDATTYETTRKGNYVFATVKFSSLKDSGTINVRVRADGKIFRNFTFTLKQNQLPKDGWYYEKYNGKTYKRYYVEGVLQTDLTDVLGIKESTNSNYNNFRVEVNRAACCVTVYAYDSNKQSYCIPVKTCTVSVGRDTWSTKGHSDLNEDTSYTPLGDFKISSNGTSVKYSMKPMYEPDGSIVYARWASHVVGNVYFHSIAVSSNSHYALNPSHYNKLGSPASAGCIRMTVADAKWFYDYVSKGTPVKIIQGNANYPGPLGKNPTIKISSSINYDPTDSEVPNSRKQKDYKAGRISGYMTSSGKKVGY